MEKVYKLAIVNTHPFQYSAPLYRRLAADPRIDLTVYFLSRQGADAYLDDQFGAKVEWDVPLLEGFSHRFIPNVRTPDRVESFLRPFNPGIVSELWRNRYDAVWVNGHNYLSLLLTIAAARLFGMAVLTRGETHLRLRQSPLKARLRRPVMGFMYNVMCTAHLALGRMNREFLLAMGVPEERVFVSPYTVDNDYFCRLADESAGREVELRRKYELPEDVPLILFASKFMRRKRPDDLLEAYRRMRERGTRAALVFVGSGEMEAELEEAVREREIPDVHFLGFRNQSELPGLYALTDVFVLPSHDEPWGLIINEVMCAGLPVVATDEIGAVADLVEDGRNGFTFAAGDVPALSRHLERLAGDAALRERMAEESRRAIAQWSYDASIEGVVAALDWIVRTGRSGRRRDRSAPVEPTGGRRP